LLNPLTWLLSPGIRKGGIKYTSEKERKVKVWACKECEFACRLREFPQELSQLLLRLFGTTVFTLYSPSRHTSLRA